jgi:hypothetical protein
LYTGINQLLPLLKQPSMSMGNGNGNTSGNNGDGDSKADLPRGNPSFTTKPSRDAKGNIIDRNGPGKGVLRFMIVT